MFTFHEGVSAYEKERMAKAIGEGRTVILLPDAKNFSPAEVAKFLISRGVKEATPAFVCENLTLNDERVVKSTLSEVSKTTFDSLCVMVIKPSPQH